MIEIRPAIAQYLQIRRAQGGQLDEVSRHLNAFATFLEDTGATVINVETAVTFASTPAVASARTKAVRLSAVRGFTRWAHTLDAEIEVPPGGLLKARSTRHTPYIYTQEDVAQLLNAANRMKPMFRAHTFQTLIGLMASLGIRTGEAAATNLTDFDPVAGTLRVSGKHSKTRMLPLHASVRDALIAYLPRRRLFSPASECPALLVSTTGTRLSSTSVSYGFRDIRGRTTLAARSLTCQPRLYDLRHTFAVNALLQVYQSGQDPMVALPILSTWLGHASPADTYWYLSSTPQLMEAALNRVVNARGVLS